MERKKWGRGGSQNGGQGGGFRRNKQNQKGAQQSGQNGPQEWLNEAGKLKQNAERKEPGTAAAAAFQRSAELYQAAIQSNSLRPEELQEAYFDLGEALLRWGEYVQTAAQIALGLPSLEPSKRRAATRAEVRQLEASARLNAIGLFRRSHEAYEAARASANGALSLAQEAAVNSGNALSSWAEVVLEMEPDEGGGPVAAANLLERAEASYVSALSSTPDDVEALTNLGDCLVRLAELSAADLRCEGTPGCFPVSGTPSPPDTIAGGGAAGMELEDEPARPTPFRVGGFDAARWESARATYDRAMEAYGEACAHTDERRGDDLAGLLQNWGAGLLSLAQHCPDSEEALTIFEQAEAKLCSAAEFRATDVEPFLALGDALGSHAEHVFSLPGFRSEALRLFSAAVGDGYSAVRRIDAANVPARIGEADLLLTTGKLLLADGTDRSTADSHLSRSVDLYSDAIQLAVRAGGGEVTYADQCDALYNLACGAALCGRHMEALRSLECLASVGAVAPSDLVQDEDFTPLRNQDRFQLLLASMP